MFFSKSTTGGEHHVPWIVEQVNHLLGPAVYSLQKAVMTSIDPNWHGDPHMPIPTHVVMASIAFLICTVGAYLFRGQLSVENPSNRQQILEGFVQQLRDMVDQVVGQAFGRRHLPVIGSFAFFILISNLMGLVPGLLAPTVSINVTLALGITSFIYYISMGFKQQGLHYLKHFTGGLTGTLLYLLGPVIFIVEVVSNFVRPVTLSVRLFINIFADEQIAEAFGSLMPYVVPSILLILAVFVAFVQTFIFVMLSLVYLSETVPHDDHEGHEHAH
ncbi:MAG: F0F1 ATP synthase subunit A [Acidobacteriota bacterium]|nr:F0F1 ATP synthase subunit A [Blastocatellia bacterium]MDW8412387.1 F0F1 ATP synthase subunit A [Acidobacteriota bacterium]